MVYEAKQMLEALLKDGLTIIRMEKATGPSHCS